MSINCCVALTGPNHDPTIYIHQTEADHKPRNAINESAKGARMLERYICGFYYPIYRSPLTRVVSLLSSRAAFGTAMVISYSCALLTLTLCATPPSLGSAKSATGYRAAAPLQEQQRTQQRGRLGLNDNGCALLPLPTTAEAAASDGRRRDNKWWWGGRGGLSRIGAARGGRCLAKLRKDAAVLARREQSGQRAGGLEAALGLARCVNLAVLACTTESNCVVESCIDSDTAVAGTHGVCVCQNGRWKIEDAVGAFCGR